MPTQILGHSPFCTSLLPAMAAAAPPTTPAATLVGLTLFSWLIPSPVWGDALATTCVSLTSRRPSYTPPGGWPSDARPSWAIGIIFCWGPSYTGNAPARATHPRPVRGATPDYGVCPNRGAPDQANASATSSVQGPSAAGERSDRRWRRR